MNLHTTSHLGSALSSGEIVQQDGDRPKHDGMTLASENAAVEAGDPLAVSQASDLDVGQIDERLRGQYRKGLLSRFLTGTFGARFTVMAIRVVSMALNFLVLIVMARVMTLAAFGSANTALAILNILVVPAAFGYDTASIRYVALAQEDQPRLRALTVRLGRTVAIGCAATAAASGVGAFVEYELGSEPLAVGLALLVMIIPAFAIVRVGEAWLRGAGSVIRAQINSNLIVPALTIALLLMQLPLMGSDHNVSVAGALGARAIATAISAGLVGLFVLRMLHGRLRPRAALGDDEAHDMRNAAMTLCGVNVLAMVVSQIDIVAVSYLRGPSAAGIYSAASRVSLAMNVCIITVAFVLAPHVSQLFAERRTARLQHEVGSAASWSAGLMVAACIVVIPASPLVLSVFGPDFGAGADALRILMLGQLANGICGPVAIVLNMTGKQVLAIRALAIGTVVDLVLLAGLVPLLGLTGAACATAICTLIWNLVMLIYARRDLRIWALPGFLVRVAP
jgi:O-antigen/teichoic acid export membrane protein